MYLDTATPRVCVRGAEDRGRADGSLGYDWLRVPSSRLNHYKGLPSSSRVCQLFRSQVLSQASCLGGLMTGRSGRGAMWKRLLCRSCAA